MTVDKEPDTTNSQKGPNYKLQTLRTLCKTLHEINVHLFTLEKAMTKFKLLHKLTKTLLLAKNF